MDITRNFKKLNYLDKGRSLQFILKEEKRTRVAGSPSWIALFTSFMQLHIGKLRELIKDDKQKLSNTN